MRSRVVVLLTALLAPLVAVLGGPTSTAAPAVPAAAAAAARANNDPGFLVVWDNNVENLETAREYCRGDYRDLLAAMRRSTLKPDLFLVQQVSGARQLRSYVREISRRLGETYRGVIANPSPRKMGSPCKGPKSHQTNAIVYRDARFDTVGAKQVFRADSFRNGRCAPSPQDRTQAVKQRLLDVVSGKTVVVASIHWATGKSGGTPCAGANARGALRRIGEAHRMADRNGLVYSDHKAIRARVYY